MAPGINSLYYYCYYLSAYQALGPKTALLQVLVQVQVQVLVFCCVLVLVLVLLLGWLLDWFGC